MEFSQRTGSRDFWCILPRLENHHWQRHRSKNNINGRESEQRDLVYHSYLQPYEVIDTQDTQAKHGHEIDDETEIAVSVS